MKKSLSDVFGRMKPEELTELLEGVTAEPPEEAAGRIRQRILAALPKKKRWGTKWIGTAAACLVVAVTMTLVVCALEAKAYQEAMTFFNAHDLPTEGLSRGEIKEVYRDITTESYSHSKTAEVIGAQIFQEVPTPEQVEQLWNERYGNGDPPAEGIRYSYNWEYKLDEKLGFDVHDRSVIRKLDGEAVLWELTLTEFQAWGVEPVRGGVVIYGHTPTWSSKQRNCPWLAFASDTGELLWQKKLDNGFDRESIEFVLDNGDGTYAVLSRGDLEYFCLSQFDDKGNRLVFQKTSIGNYGLWNAARVDDGYLVQIGNYTTLERARLLKVDKSGAITEDFSYKSDDSYYYISDMAEFDGKIYLSAYAVPALEDEEENAGGRYEIAKILQDIFDKNQMGITDEELTPMVQEHYTALLLVCDWDSGAPQEFYSVDGSLGGKLAVGEDGTLQWDVETVVTTFFSPMTSSFTIGGTCAVFRYTFDEGGNLVEQQNTGELVPYRR